MSVTNSDIKTVENIAYELIQGLKLSLKPEVSADTEGIKVNLVGKDTAIIIGYHGETLSDFAYMLSLMTRKALDKSVSIRVDSGEYLKNKDKRIKAMAGEAIEKVKRSGFPEKLTGLNSYERRIVHAEATKEGLTSESNGFGRDRYITIKPGV